LQFIPDQDTLLFVHRDPIRAPLRLLGPLGPLGPLGLLGLIGLLAGSAQAAPSVGATILVPTDVPTIQGAHDAAMSGDTILVAPGTYVGKLNLSKAVTLASFQSLGGDAAFVSTTILDGNGGSYVVQILPGAEDRPVLQGFTIQDAGDGIYPHAPFDLIACRVWDTSDGVDYESGSGGLVRDCLFELNSDDGIDLDDDCAVVIDNCVIRDNGDDGIEIRMQPWTGPLLQIVISRCTISGNGEDGIQLIHYDVLTNRLIRITRNLIQGNAFAGIGMMGGGDTVEDFQAASIPEPILVFDNTFAGNTHGISGGDTTIVVNNIFLDHSVLAVKRVDGFSALAYNLYFGNAADISGSNVNLGSSVFDDPLLTAAFKPSPGSPAIDAGTAFYTWHGFTVLDLPPSAYAGTAPDLGAFEKGGGPALIPPGLAIPGPAVGPALLGQPGWTGAGVGANADLASDKGN
jgi:hypothetical protein